MPPFAKFRGHRRNGSNPSSPKPSPNLHTPDSPFQQWGANNSPGDSSIPSHHWRIPSLSDSRTKDASDDRPPVLPTLSSDSAQFSAQFSFDHPRPASSSSSTTYLTRQSSSFQPPQRLNIESGEHAHPHSSEGVRPSVDQKPLPKQPISYLRERIPTDELEEVKTQHVPKANRTRLNLLNPMSLLARRRTSQAATEQKPDDSDLQINSLAIPAIPEDYDPRIRGKIVHDFSNPRPRRNLISPESGTFQGPQPSPGLSDRSKTEPYIPRFHHAAKSDKPVEKTMRSPEHAPMFKEHFNDDRKALRPESTGYLQSIAVASIKQPDRDQPPVPAFAKNLPLRLPDHPTSTDLQSRASVKDNAVERKKSNVSQNVVTSSDQHPEKPKSPPPEPPNSQNTLPKHMKSTSSRFSFQLASVGSAAQEKLLEEGYKQKEATRRAQARSSLAEDYEEEDFANYDFDDGGAFEESIPGVNVDADEDEYKIIEEQFAHVNGETDKDDSSDDLQETMLEGFHFTPTAPNMLSPTTTDATGQTSYPTPRDDQGQAIGFAYSKESPQTPFLPSTRSQKAYDTAEVQGLGISAPQQFSSPLAEALQDDAADAQFDDDELYFDDGFIEDAPALQLEPIDETIFDDETGKIKNIPLQNEARFEEAFGVPMSRAANTTVSNRLETNIRAPVSDSHDLRRTVPGVEKEEESHSSDSGPIDNGVGLTEGNLEAYHNALASAANAAAAKGRFDRESVSSEITDNADAELHSEQRDSHPGLISDDSRLSHNMEKVASEDWGDDDDFDESLLDDPMIAEANAEALANDDEGFYGQEFGFYSRAHQKGNTEPVHGGYWGPRGIEGVHRSHSAKANFQEPSLTPITERSEWSHRNSVASLQTFGIPQSAQSVSSPGLANLLELGTLEGDNMTLEALMKLRRNAWGGSQTSLVSSTSQNSSPLVAHLPAQQLQHSYTGDSVTGTFPAPGQGMARSAGTPDSADDDSDSDDPPPSPTLTQNTPQRERSSIIHSPNHQKYMPVFSPLLPQQTPDTGNGNGHNRKTHSRQSSGADSVSYMRDPDIADRWILERRRTGDDGEIEVIGREILSGGI
ncbi:MAG: hypothetical protein Q9160_004818 [Pyrenula sp. 1 TL-2023]